MFFFVFTIVTVFHMAIEAWGLLPPSYVYSPLTNCGYKKFPTKENWFDALQYCEAEGASLFVPNNEAEVKEVRKMFGNDEWPLGITDSDSARVFKTVDGRSIREVYNKWHRLEPSTNPSFHCVMLGSDNLLKVRTCERQNYYVCKVFPTSLSESRSNPKFRVDSGFFADLAAREGAEPVASEPVNQPWWQVQSCGQCVNKTGQKIFFLQPFYRGNWYQANFYCRYQGMELASINSKLENDQLEKQVVTSGIKDAHIWTSGFDKALEGTYSWMSTGKLVAPYSNWVPAVPTNTKVGDETEDCLAITLDKDNKLTWHAHYCSNEHVFVCEVDT